MATAKIKNINEAFVSKIQALYFIENELTKALPKLEKASTDPELKEGFKIHLEETEEHIQRLEEIFKILDEKPKKLECEGILGIIEDGAWVMKVNAPDNIKDSMIAGAARHAEHYEMSGYLSAIIEANALGLFDVKTLLETTLEEENIADEKLSTIMIANLGVEEV